MLARDNSPTKPAAAAGVIQEKKSWIIGEACSRTPIPAVTLQKSTVHNSQNCGVRIELLADTSAVVCRSLVSSSVGGVQPPGCQPSAGRRTTNAPIIIETRYTAPSVRNEGTIAFTGSLAKVESNVLESGEAISAPPPKPMMARPVARPGRSGNHLINVETG